MHDQLINILVDDSVSSNKFPTAECESSSNLLVLLNNLNKKKKKMFILNPHLNLNLNKTIILVLSNFAHYIKFTLEQIVK